MQVDIPDADTDREDVFTVENPTLVIDWNINKQQKNDDTLKGKSFLPIKVKSTKSNIHKIQFPANFVFWKNYLIINSPEHKDIF